MATTRSSMKCSLSNISLDPEESTVIEMRIFHSRLLSAWTSQFQNTPDNCTGSTDEINERKINFIRDQFNLNLTESMCGALLTVAQVQKNILYYKVLCAWLLSLDARVLLDLLVKSMNSFSDFYMTVDGANTYSCESAYAFFDCVLNVLLTGQDYVKILSSIDDHKLLKAEDRFYFYEV